MEKIFLQFSCWTLDSFVVQEQLSQVIEERGSTGGGRLGVIGAEADRATVLDG